MPAKGKIGVLIESHYDEHEFQRFNQFFPANGYQVVYLSYLWGQPSLTYKGNDINSEVTVATCVTRVKPTDYDGIILIGGYAMDRLRYQVNPKVGGLNDAPAVEFLRKAVRAMDSGELKIGTICHTCGYSAPPRSY